MHFRERGWDEEGGFHLKIVARKEEPSDFLNYPCAEPKMTLSLGQPFLFFQKQSIL
jgi:hypothetical protein